MVFKAGWLAKGTCSDPGVRRSSMDTFLCENRGVISGREGICHPDTEDLALMCLHICFMDENGMWMWGLPHDKLGCLTAEHPQVLWCQELCWPCRAPGGCVLVPLERADVCHCRQPSCWCAEGEASRGMPLRAAPVLPGLPAVKLF